MGAGYVPFFNWSLAENLDRITRFFDIVLNKFPKFETFIGGHITLSERR